jgi:hypothetical protein
MAGHRKQSTVACQEMPMKFLALSFSLRAEPTPPGPAQFCDFVAGWSERFGEIVERAKITPES